jgi:hypothetical protein
LRAPPTWYKIPEIPFGKYVECLEGVYKVLEVKNQTKGEDDLFMKCIMQSYSNISEEQWSTMERSRRNEKALTMKMGDFHEELAGKFKGYKTLKNGDSSECDVIKEDGSEIWEWKNRDNTMNHKHAKQTITVLERHYQAGKTTFLVFVNCKKKKPPRFGAPTHINVLTGRQAYAYLSGRDSFYEDLQGTLLETFKRFQHYQDLVETV